VRSTSGRVLPRGRILPGSRTNFALHAVSVLQKNLATDEHRFSQISEGSIETEESVFHLRESVAGFLCCSRPSLLFRGMARFLPHYTIRKVLPMS